MIAGLYEMACEELRRHQGDGCADGESVDRRMVLSVERFVRRAIVQRNLSRNEAVDLVYFIYDAVWRDLGEDPEGHDGHSPYPAFPPGS